MAELYYSEEAGRWTLLGYCLLIMIGGTIGTCVCVNEKGASGQEGASSKTALLLLRSQTPLAHTHVPDCQRHVL